MATDWWDDPAAGRLAPLAADWIRVRRALARPVPPPPNPPAAVEFYPPLAQSLFAFPARPSWQAGLS